MRRTVLFALTAVWLGLTSSACIPVPIPIYPARQPLGTALDSQGRMHVLYHDGSGYRHGIIQGFLISSEVVDSDVECDSAFPGYEGRMAFDVDPAGNPHLACPTSEGLAHIWKEAGSWNSEMVDFFENSSLMTRSSLAIDTTGAIHIGYPVMVMEQTEMEIRYAVKRNGAWTLEVADSRDTSDLGGWWWYPGAVPFPIAEISLTPDGNPVIASTNGGNPWYYGGAWEALNKDGVVRVAERTPEGTWDAEEIFYEEEYDDMSFGINVYDLSLAISPSGEKAVAFILGESMGVRRGSYNAYYIMKDDGSGWEVALFSAQDCGFGRDCLWDYSSQDIDYDAANRLHVFFSREHWEDIYQLSKYTTCSLARHTESGWQETTVWDPTLWPYTWGEIDSPSCPFLHMGGSPDVRVVYSDSGQMQYMGFSSL